ncbi:unnamed protein product [Adineta steineri]|uniref:Uncharacterized protein n=1 Tax=Adineta steineri TaxID=433720 RepID=A0A814CV54_9BILA|nr:unnamed protein product [Adineta steineri]CAF0955067.1 unnamed protein product [Adineta steineri]CAF0960093.1 unnamed protein product [Adineta steineri]
MVRLSVLINDLNGQIDKVIRNIQQKNVVAAACVQYQQPLPTFSESPYYSSNYPMQQTTSQSPHLQVSTNNRSALLIFVDFLSVFDKM